MTKFSSGETTQCYNRGINMKRGHVRFERPQQWCTLKPEVQKAERIGKIQFLSVPNNGSFMKINVIVHKAEEGGYWAEVPAIPGCATQGETMDTLIANIREAIEGCLSVTVPESCGSEQEVLEQ